jgi:hypothetical protein
LIPLPILPQAARALQFEQDELLMLTLTAVAFVAALALRLYDNSEKERLNVKAPVWSTLNEPPQLLAPKRFLSLFAIALHSMPGESLTLTLIFATLVAALSLLLLTPSDKLHACAPT